MRALLGLTLLALAFCRARAEEPFEGPHRIALPFGANLLEAGDFDGDGRIDLLRWGTEGIQALLQAHDDRDTWVPGPPGPSPNGITMLRVVDLDGDGIEDVVLVDSGSGVSIIRSRGGGAFEEPINAGPLATPGVRTVAAGDLDGDGNLDLALGFFGVKQVQVLAGSDAGKFAPKDSWDVDGRVHALEIADLDEDGLLDLIVGEDGDGTQLMRGIGGGKLRLLSAKVAGLGRHLFVCDLDGDGRTDFIASDFLGIEALINQGKMAFQWTPLLSNEEVTPLACSDLDGDGRHDLLAFSGINGRANLLYYRGKGGGGFESPIRFLESQLDVSALLARDLDGDGEVDIVEASPNSILVDWRAPGQRPIGTGVELPTQARSAQLADLDGNGTPDIFALRSSGEQVDVYLAPGKHDSGPPSATVGLPAPFTSFAAVDVNRDGVPDLVGANLARGEVYIVPLDRTGKAGASSTIPVGIRPAKVVAGRLDGDDDPDLVLPLQVDGSIAVLLGRGAADFSAVRTFPTIAKPKSAAIADLDGDGWSDVVVMSGNEVAVHAGDGQGGLGPALTVYSTPVASTLFTDLLAADIDGDGRIDLAVADGARRLVHALPGDGAGGFSAAIDLAIGESPASLAVADLDGDGRTDLAISGSSLGTLWFLRRSGGRTFDAPVGYPLNLPVLGIRLGDLDGDGAIDAVAYGTSGSVILFGRKPSPTGARFLRGDADGSRAIDLTDAIALLAALFQGGAPPGCLEAADANDDGKLDITDVTAILGTLFLGAGPLPPPGPVECGADPTPDGLGCGRGC